MLEQVVSGGQNGVDIAALRAAKKCGFMTGGWLPKGCVTIAGSNFELLKEFNMKEHAQFGYPPRTEANVRDSDGTLRIAANFRSKGEICTLNAIKWYKKPYFDINIQNPLPVEKVVEWILKENIKILNVAGNSESTSLGIEATSEKYLEQVFLYFVNMKLGE